MDNIDRIMKEVDQSGFGVSYGKYQAACFGDGQKSVSAPAKPKQQEKPSVSCRRCGKKFTAHHANQVYCSPECNYAVKLDRQNAWRKNKGAPEMEQMILVCAECGADFKAVRRTSKYCCKECAHEGNLKAQARWRAAQKKRG